MFWELTFHGDRRIIRGMRRFLPVAAGLLALALLLPATLLAGHPCCHPAAPGVCCRESPLAEPPCGETSLEHGCHCRIAPATDASVLLAETRGPVHTRVPAPPAAATTGLAGAAAARTAPPVVTPAPRAGPGTPLYLATGHFLS